MKTQWGKTERWHITQRQSQETQWKFASSWIYSYNSHILYELLKRNRSIEEGTFANCSQMPWEGKEDTAGKIRRIKTSRWNFHKTTWSFNFPHIWKVSYTFYSHLLPGLLIACSSWSEEYPAWTATRIASTPLPLSYSFLSVVYIQCICCLSTLSSTFRDIWSAMRIFRHKV
jgi:hypothetical protein